MNGLGDYDYPLPRDRVAQDPLPRRDASRLMVLDRGAPGARHARFRDLPEFLRPGDLLVLNDTRVVPARLVGVRATGGRVAVLLTRRADDAAPFAWEVMVEGGRRLLGETLTFEGVRGRMVRWERGRGRMTFDANPLGPRAGDARRAPLPPYIKRPKSGDSRRALDLRRYQTVYAGRDGRSIAAPTAGLHFTRGLLRRLGERGVRVTAVSLAVGPGTFQPVREEDVSRHRMEPERFAIPPEAVVPLRAAKAEGRRVVAVGTTTCRALEAAFRALAPHGKWPGAVSGWTDLFIRPPFEFRVVDALITNFHLPRSTLLMLACAFAGRERVLSAYGEAIRRGYRFYSYGDAMLVL